jgi:hypothetical protein
MSKKEQILKLNEQGNLTRAEIARQVNCSAAFVTNTLGTQRPYRKRQEGAGQEQTPEKVVG